MKLAPGTGAVPAFILPRCPQGALRALPCPKCRPPFHHVGPRRPFSLTWGGDHRAATSGRVGKELTFSSLLGRPRCLIPSVRPEGIWPQTEGIVVPPCDPFRRNHPVDGGWRGAPVGTQLTTRRRVQSPALSVKEEMQCPHGSDWSSIREAGRNAWHVGPRPAQPAILAQLTCCGYPTIGREG